MTLRANKLKNLAQELKKHKESKGDTITLKELHELSYKPLEGVKEETRVGYFRELGRLRVLVPTNNGFLIK
jgi:hypothetical protein